MNWRLVLTLATSFGLLIGLAMILHWPAEIVVKDIPIYAATGAAFILAFKGRRVFAEGLFTGLLFGVFLSVLTLVVGGQYTDPNTNWMMQSVAMKDASKGFNMDCLRYVLSSTIGLGLSIGIVAWVHNKLFCPRKNSNATAEHS